MENRKERRKAKGRGKKRKGGEKEGRKVEKMQGGGHEEVNKSITQSSYSWIAVQEVL